MGGAYKRGQRSCGYLPLLETVQPVGREGNHQHRRPRGLELTGHLGGHTETQGGIKGAWHLALAEQNIVGAQLNVDFIELCPARLRGG